MIATLLGLMLKVVLLVALGYYVKRKGMISDETERGLSNLLVNIIFPISVIASADNDFSADKLKNILIMMAIALVYYIAAILISTKAGRLLGLSNPDQRIFMTMSHRIIVHQYDISGFNGSIGAQAAHGNSDIRSGKNRCIINSVSNIGRPGSGTLFF